MDSLKQLTRRVKKMSYAEFKKEYDRILTLMLSYDIGQAGSNIYQSELADLVEANPEHEEAYDLEMDAAWLAAITLH